MDAGMIGLYDARTPSHSVEFEGFVDPKTGVLRDQVCTTFGPKVNCEMQVDFW